MNKILTPDEALQRLEALCARSEQCSSDLMKKLRRWGIPQDAAEEILENLKSTRHLDDSRFASAYVRDKYLFAGWGRNKIKAGMYAKGITRSDINTALASINTREYAKTAFRAIKAKLRTTDRTDMNKCRDKLLRFGLSRGYEMALILRIIDSKSLWLEKN